MLALTLLLTGSLLTEPIALNPSRDRGVYVYGDLLLDFVVGTERRWNDARLVNCSSTGQYCVDGGIVNFVVPRRCQPVRLGDRWRSGALETEVIGLARLVPNAHARALGMPAASAFYIRTNQRPDVVMLYAPGYGVLRIFHDVRGETDFAALARSGALDGFYEEAIRDPTRQHMAADLRTFDSLAECDRRERLGAS